MRNVYFILACVCFSVNLFGQKAENNIMRQWFETESRIQDIDKLTTCDKGPQDVLLKEALDSLERSRQYIQRLASLNTGYIAEVKYMCIQVLIDYEVFSRRTCTNHIFTTKLVLTIVKEFESRMAEVKRMSPSDFKLPYLKFTQAELDEFLFLTYRTCYDIYTKVLDKEGAVNALHRYIALLRTKYTNPLTFCSDLCHDATMSSQVSSLKKMLISTSYTQWGVHELDYTILRLELDAYTKSNTTNSVNSKLIDVLSKTSLLQQVLVIELSLDLKNQDEIDKRYAELTRLKQALLTLELYDSYQRVYTALIKSSRANDEDRWLYLETMKNLGNSTASTIELMDYVYSDMVDVCNRMFDACKIQEGSEEQYKRLQAYYDAAKNADGVTKCSGALASIETLRQKREKKEAFQRNWGLSVGFAPIKTLFFGGKQSSYFADLTTFGLTHGVRYCKFDGFTDNYRFYSWLINDDKPGGSFTYSGYEASYWIALFTMRDEFVQQRVCLEYRYGNYSFEPLTNATLLNRSTGDAAFTGVTVNPVGINKDLTLVYRLQLFAGSRFFVEGNVGLGLGYRTLKADQDLKTYEIDDDSFNDVRWNRITLPGRLGLRCGIKLF